MIYRVVKITLLYRMVRDINNIKNTFMLKFLFLIWAPNTQEDMSMSTSRFFLKTES